MSGISGPGRKALKALIVQIEHVADGTVRDELKMRLGAEAVSLVSEGFRTATDPYGRAWKPNKYRGGSTLRDTGRLLASFNSQPTAPGFEVGTNVKYAAIHQFGGVIKPKNAKALRFVIVTGSRFRALRGGGRLKKPVATTSVVFAKSVTIPRRQIVPEDDLGDRWTRGFNDETEALLREHFDET